MNEKERVKEMNDIIKMEQEEEAKRVDALNKAEDAFNKEEEEYSAKINKKENEILEEQDRVGALGKSN